MSSPRRLFAGGSLPAPDPFDQFLEDNGLYRKHTARDSSCLFRVISEQLYDTQQYHLKVRESCVSYMRLNKKYFEREILNKNFDTYLEELSNYKTHGSFVELKALGYRYKRNILLYQAHDVGTCILKNKEFQNCFRVFFTPDKHFDSIFTIDFVDKVAFCQAISYEILYRDVYQLPDVMFAVEVMLHDPEQQNMKFETLNECMNNDHHIVILDDGREFYFDQPENTSCILNNYLLCNFHNHDFNELHTDLLNELEGVDDNYNNVRINRIIDSLLPHKNVSCVRQLLNEGITPFPYKVAKSLDPDIYRNVEFDVWSEHRKEMRFRNWYHHDGTTGLQVGLKCLVKLTSSQKNVYNCHIQEMSPSKGPCLVYIEELGEKQCVPYRLLQPHPDYSKMKWPVQISSYRKYNNKRYSRQQSHGARNKKRNYKRVKESKMRNMINNKYHVNHNMINNKYNNVNYNMMRMSELTDIGNFQPSVEDITVMPLIRETHQSKSVIHNNNNHHTHTIEPIQQVPKFNNEKNKSVSSNNDFKEDYKNELEYVNSCQDVDGGGYYQTVNYDQNLPFPYDPCNPPPAPQIIGGQFSYMTPTGTPFFYTNYGSIGSYQTQPVPYFNLNNSQMNTTPISYIPGTNIVITRKDLLQSCVPINYCLKPSYSPDGCDIPMNDLPSTRFYYNLGHEVFKHVQNQCGMNGVSFLTQYDPMVEQTIIIGSEHDVKQTSADLQNLQIEDNIQSNTNTPPPLLPPNKRYVRNNNTSNNNNNNSGVRKENKNTQGNLRNTYKNNNNHKNTVHTTPVTKDNESQNISAERTERIVPDNTEYYPVSQPTQQYSGNYSQTHYYAPETADQPFYYPQYHTSTYTNNNIECNNIEQTAYSYHPYHPYPVLYPANPVSRPPGGYPPQCWYPPGIPMQQYIPPTITQLPPVILPMSPVNTIAQAAVHEEILNNIANATGLGLPERETKTENINDNNLTQPTRMRMRIQKFPVKIFKPKRF